MPIKIIVCFKEQLLIYGRHIDDVITSLKHVSEMGDYFQMSLVVRKPVFGVSD